MDLLSESMLLKSFRLARRLMVHKAVQTLTEDELKTRSMNDRIDELIDALPASVMTTLQNKQLEEYKQVLLDNQLTPSESHAFSQAQPSEPPSTNTIFSLESQSDLSESGESVHPAKQRGLEQKKHRARVQKSFKEKNPILGTYTVTYSE